MLSVSRVSPVVASPFGKAKVSIITVRLLISKLLFSNRIVTRGLIIVTRGLIIVTRGLIIVTRGLITVASFKMQIY